MKRLKFLSFSILLMAVCSCNGRMSDCQDTRTYQFSDSCKFVSLNVMLELPAGKDPVSQKIREALIADFVMNSQQPAADGGQTQVAQPLLGDGYDIQALVDSCGKATYVYLLASAEEVCNASKAYLDKDSTLTPEEKERILSEAPQWEFDLKVCRQTEASNFVVYNSSAYVYYGGAHGGVTGSGSLTFDKATGSKIDRFIRNDATGSIQPLLRDGLRRYYKGCGEELSDSELMERLFIEDSAIPLPVDAACPNAAGDSLIFTYRQYEIASYADGMPSFGIPVGELGSFLTQEGLSLLCE